MPDVLGKSLWRLYAFILGASFLILLFAMYFLWNSIVQDEKNRLIYSNKIVTHSIHSILNKNEALFEVISKHILENGMFENPKESLLILSVLLKQNPELAGISLVDTLGNVRISTINNSKNSMPNLLSKPETSKSFTAALESDSLVMGRTYFSDDLNQWVVPIRSRITDSHQTVVAVLAAVLKLEGKDSPWQSDNLGKNMQVSIINSDFYFQYISFVSPLTVPDIYNKPIEQNFLEIFNKYLFQETGLSLEDFKQSANEVVSLKYLGKDNRMSIGAFNYDKKYKNYIFTFNKIDTLYHKLSAPFVWLISVLILFNLILYSLFKKLNETQLKSKQDLKHQIQYDHLTKLPNLKYLKSHFDRWKSEHNNECSVIFIDLDNFKICNDLHGHYIGDEILKKVASRIQIFFKKSMCVRQGGDEFIIITPSIESSQIKRVCFNFLDSLKKTMLISNLDFKINASIGISLAPKDGTDIDTLMRKADIAMFDAKNKKSHVEIFSKELAKLNSRNSLIAKEINNALDRNEMSLFYQPQYNGLTNEIIGVEALLRWNNLVLGDVPPDEFIPIAESTGIILEIDSFVLKTSISDFNDIYKSIKNKTSNFRLSINSSVLQLSEVKFSAMLLSIIDKYKDGNYKIMLEITESMLIDRFEDIVNSLNILKKSEIDFSLDDFGTGYSSLSYLSKLPISEIKIDKSFICDIEEKNNHLTLVRSIINLGKSLNIEVIAEGVETEKQLKILLDNNCKYFQGFYFSKPLSCRDIKQFLSNL